MEARVIAFEQYSINLMYYSNRRWNTSLSHSNSARPIRLPYQQGHNIACIEVKHNKLFELCKHTYEPITIYHHKRIIVRWQVSYMYTWSSTIVTMYQIRKVYSNQDKWSSSIKQGFQKPCLYPHQILSKIIENIIRHINYSTWTRNNCYKLKYLKWNRWQ